jgi:hypothetical protein
VQYYNTKHQDIRIQILTNFSETFSGCFVLVHSTLIHITERGLAVRQDQVRITARHTVLRGVPLPSGSYEDINNGSHLYVDTLVYATKTSGKKQNIFGLFRSGKNRFLRRTENIKWQVIIDNMEKMLIPNIKYDQYQILVCYNNS